MDPVSVAGIVQSSLGLALQLGKVAKSLGDVADNYKNAELTVKSLAQNLEILQLTWRQISQWFEAFVEEEEFCDNDLVERVRGFLETGILVMEAFEKDILAYEVENLSFTRRSKLIWNENTLQAHQVRIRDQTMSMSLFLQAIKLPTPNARANLLRNSEDQFQKSDESAYSINSVNPSQISLSTSKRRSQASSSLGSLDYRPLSFENKLFLSRVYMRNSKDIMIKRIFKTRKKEGPPVPDWEAIRNDLEADSLLLSTQQVSLADNEPLRPSSYHQDRAQGLQKIEHLDIATNGHPAVFIQACEQGDSVQVRKSLVDGLDVHTRFTGIMYFGYTAIHVATLYGHINVVETLLDHSANIEEEDARGKRRPLHFAAGSRKLPMVRFLIQRGAQVDARARDAIQPIHEASWSGSVEILDALIEAGAAVNCTDKFGYQPLHWAVFTPNQPDVIKFLSDKNADINAEISSGFKAVHLACKTDPQNLSALLVLGAQTDFDDGTESALVTAVKSQDEKAVKLLLEHGVSPNRQASDGSTALHTLATLHSVDMGESSNEKETGQLLLDNGADFHIEDRNWNQALHCLPEQDSTSMESFGATKEPAELLLVGGVLFKMLDRAYI